MTGHTTESTVLPLQMDQGETEMTTTDVDIDLDSICADLDTRRQYIEAGRQPSVTTFLTNSLIDRMPALVAEVRRLRAAAERVATDFEDTATEARIAGLRGDANDAEALAQKIRRDVLGTSQP